MGNCPELNERYTCKGMLYDRQRNRTTREANGKRNG